MWEIDRKSLDKNEVENLTNFVEVRLFKVFWNYLDINYVFQSNVTYKLYVVLTPYYVWFLGDHPIWSLYSLWQWNQIQVSALSLWMTRSSLLPMGGRDSLIVCGWGCCPWGQETTSKRGPIWRALSATHGWRKKPEGMGEAAIHGTKSPHTREDNIMLVVNGWIPWLVYVVAWYICDNLSYVRYYGFGNYIIDAHRL